MLQWLWVLRYNLLLTLFFVQPHKIPNKKALFWPITYALHISTKRCHYTSTDKTKQFNHSHTSHNCNFMNSCLKKKSQHLSHTDKVCNTQVHYTFFCLSLDFILSKRHNVIKPGLFRLRQTKDTALGHYNNYYLYYFLLRAASERVRLPH